MMHSITNPLTRKALTALRDTGKLTMFVDTMLQPVPVFELEMLPDLSCVVIPLAPYGKQWAMRAAVRDRTNAQSFTNARFALDYALTGRRTAHVQFLDGDANRIY